ncbi:hypothetical protein ACOMHN_035156 [Nucella lapillus]
MVGGRYFCSTGKAGRREEYQNQATVISPMAAELERSERKRLSAPEREKKGGSPTNSTEEEGREEEGITFLPATHCML